MALAPLLTDGALDALRQFDTCMVANAVETFNVRLRNTGFTNADIRCRFEDVPPMVGYAATARLRSGQPPVVGSKFRDRGDFWNSILEIPAPRILVLEDKDDPPGRGAFVGDMHAAILKALGCIGYLTNGAVRELPAVRELGMQLFAGSVAVSHAYAHIFDIGAAICVGGMEVRPGDLLHGGRSTAQLAASPMRNAEYRANRMKARRRHAFSWPVCPCQSVYCSQAASRADISSRVNDIVGASLTLGRFSLSARFSLHQPRSIKKRPTARRRSSFFPPEMPPSFHCPRKRLSSGNVICVVNWRPASAQNCKSDGECFSRFSGSRWLMSRTRYFFRLASESRCASMSARNAAHASATGIPAGTSCWTLPAISQSRVISLARVQSRRSRDLFTRNPRRYPSTQTGQPQLLSLRFPFVLLPVQNRQDFTWRRYRFSIAVTCYL